MMKEHGMESTSNPIIITGADGQVGRALLAEAKERGLAFKGLSRADLDLTETESIALKLDSFKPAAIINAAAYTAVDKAEEEESKATLINGQAPGIMAAYCNKKNIPFLHYSTDYVFNGEGGHRPWKESDGPAPINAYGRSKLAGEDKALQYGDKVIIFRTSWVYDATGKNFFRTMLRLAREHESLKVVDDQWGAPSYAPHIASATLDALANAQQALTFPRGVYHLCGGGETNWCNFAKQIFTEAHKAGMEGIKVKEVLGIPSRDYPTPATRPQNSRMDCSKATQVLGVTMPHWEEGLRECITVISN
jgi:dTDP-4-dehydrorhamnose reductase